LAVCGSKPTWGKFVTIIQLTQMIIGISISSVWTYYYLSGVDCPMQHPNSYMFSSLALYASYFILFLNFYLQRYVFNQSRPVTKRPASTSAPTKSAANTASQANQKSRKPKKD